LIGPRPCRFLPGPNGLADASSPEVGESRYRSRMTAEESQDLPLYAYEFVNATEVRNAGYGEDRELPQDERRQYRQIFSDYCSWRGQQGYRLHQTLCDAAGDATTFVFEFEVDPDPV